MPAQFISLTAALVLFLLIISPAMADDWDNLLGARLQGSADRAQPWPQLAPQWQRAQRLEADAPAFQRGGKANLPQPYLKFWDNLLQRVPSLNKLQVLRLVSGFINTQFSGRSDQENYGMGEYWAAPTELFKNHGGDCEDFVIAKYFALRSLNFSADDLRMLVVEVPSRHAWHALLAARIDGQIYIVDNNFRPKDMALLHRQLSNFFILHLAFNEKGAWYYRK